MSGEVSCFEDFELNPNAYRLSHSGQVIRLERIPLELLCLLVERRGELVTRDAILERIWGKGVFIDSENAINTAIRKLRRALHDDAESPRFIATIAGKGYRFIAPVLIGNGEPTSNEKSEQQVNGKSANYTLTAAALDETQPHLPGFWSAKSLAVAGLAVIAGITIALWHLLPHTTQLSVSKSSVRLAPRALDKTSIAVLPFINLSGNREQEYFSDGITDDLIAALSRFPSLFVIARASSFTYKGKTAKVQDVASQLGVHYVLEGSVRKADEQVRITVHLADATTDTELWAEHYDRPLRDVFAMQDEIVRRIVTTLNLQLALSQQGILVPRSTEKLDAYDELLRGEEYLFSFTKDGNAKAHEMFEKAIALDPEYASAYQGLGFNYFLGWVLAFNPDPNGLEQAFQSTQRAAALDDSLAAAHSVLAQIYLQKGQYHRALSEAQRSIALDPNSAFGYLALADVLNNEEKPAEALTAVEDSMRLDPRKRADYLLPLGFAYGQLGRWREAISALKGHLVRYPEFPWTHAYLAVAYFNLGDHDSARAETAQIERIIALSPNSIVGYWAMTFILSKEGRPVEALAVAERGYTVDPSNPQILLLLGAHYTELGRWGESVATLKRYDAIYPDREREGCPCDIWLHALLAEDFAALGQRDAARAQAVEVERIFERDPNSVVGYWPLVVGLNAQGKEAEALKALEKAMRLDPGNRVKYLWAQGHLYSNLGRWAEAISALKTYLARYPGEVRPRLVLAINYIEVGQDGAARSEVAAAQRLDPQFSLKIAVAGEFNLDRERVAADLARAGLK